MEAEGDSLEPFDPGDQAMDNDPPQPEQPPASNDNENLEGPPPISEDEDLSFMGDEDGGNTDNDNPDQNNQEEEKLSEKANNILNQKLYQKIINRNDEIEDVINNYQKLVSVIPYEVVKINDVSLSRLKKALSKGRDYVINKFVESKYGENRLFYDKLDSLYTLLLDDIDSNLKKINK